MKKTIAAVTMIAAFASVPALAADIPERVAAPAPAPIVSAMPLWTGFYVGGHLGWVSHNGNMTAFTPWNGFAGFPVGGLKKSGLLGGMQAGYNYQMGAFVLGLEGDFSVVNAGGWSAINPPGTWFASRANWAATLAPRAGVAFGNALFFVKGGLAIADFDYRHNQGGNTISGGGTKSGWVLGAGLEYAVIGNLSVKAEYNYMDFGKGRTTIAGAPTIWVVPSRKIQAVKFGINYRFGGPASSVMARY